MEIILRTFGNAAAWLSPSVDARNAVSTVRAAPDWSKIVSRSVAAALLVAGFSSSARAGAPQMTVPGDFSVDNGAASYSIPIQVPPGTAHMVPRVSLDYSSQGGDGIVGFGFTLGIASSPPDPMRAQGQKLNDSPTGTVVINSDGSQVTTAPGTAAVTGKGQSTSGLPSITRCAQTIAQDSAHGGVHYDLNDRFCLGGQRLILISGTYGADGSEYRTEIESFTKVLAHGTAGSGPQWFEIHTPNGLTVEYGNTSDSRILAVGTATARTWALDKVTDKKGNYFTVTYTNDTTNGQYYPQRIDYTGNAGAGLATYNSVRFVYNTARPDITPLYQAGSRQQTTVLLTDIQTYQGANLVFDYKLAYRMGSSTLHSRLTSVSQCDPNNVCLAPTSFTWQGGSGLGTLTALSLPQSAAPSGDFNGDGLTDIFEGVPNSDFSCVSGWIGLGTATPGTFTPSTMTVTNGGTVSPACFFYPPIAGISLIPGDFTGSGFSSVATESSVTVIGNIFVNDRNNNFNELSPPAGDQTTIGGDMNGDGRTDALGWTHTSGPLWNWPNGQFGFEQGNTFTILSNGDGTFTPDMVHAFQWLVQNSSNIWTEYVYNTAADFGGTGCADLMLRVSTINTSTGTITPTGVQVNYSCGGGVLQFPGVVAVAYGDFNGDGKTDFIGVPPGGGTYSLYLSTGTSFVQSAALPSNCQGANVTSLSVGDVDGDGRADIVCGVSPNIKIYLSTGTGFVDSGTTIPIQPDNGLGVTADLNNDGAPDFVGSSSGLFLYCTSAFVPERITAIANGVGATITIAYDRLNKNSPFYSKGTSATYPTQDVDSPMYVVSQVQTSNGIGGNFTKTYTYAGARRDLQGRNFLGFASIVETDLQTSVVDTRNYRTDYPFIGRLASETRTHASTNLSTTTNTYTSTSLGGTRYFVGLQQSVVTAHDLDGTAFPTTTTAYTYDAYGNVLTENISVTDGSHHNTTNTYTNDSVNWILGQLTQTSVNSSVTNPGPPPPPQPPVAVDDHIYTNGTVPVSFDPRSNDSNPMGGTLTITGVSTPAHGTATFTGTQVTYTASGSGNLQDQFTYTIQNTAGLTATATVYVNTDTTAIVARNESIAVQTRNNVRYDPRINDDDPDGDALTITVVGTPSHGTATIQNNGTQIQYTPTGSYIGTDSFTYTVSDGHGKTAIATESVNVISGKTSNPTANSDSYSFSGTSYTFDPRTNDTDPQGDTLTIYSKTNPAHGTAAIQPGGQAIIYTPTPGYSGTDSFQYQDKNSEGNTTSNKPITLTITGSGGGGGSGGASAGTSTITRTTSYVNDPATGLVTRQTIEPASNFTLQSDYTYDAFGNRLTTTVSGAGGGPITGIVTRASSVGYDTLGQFAISATNPLSQIEHFTTDARFGTPASHTDINSVTTSWTYDTFGRLASQTNADGISVRQSYPYCSGTNGGTAACIPGAAVLVVSTTVASDGTTQAAPTNNAYFDSLLRNVGNEKQLFDARWQGLRTGYDANGRVSLTARPFIEGAQNPAWTTYTYDDLGRVTQAAMPDNSHSTYAYHGLSRSVTNDKGQVTTTVSNMQGHVAYVTDAALGITTYAYDAFGGLLGITDASGNGSNNTFDLRGNKTSSIDPDLGTWTYAYDSLGELVTQTDAKSQITNLAYDTVGRVTQRVEPTFTSTWTWDTASHGVGALASATTGSGYTRTLTYDTLGRPLTTTLTIDGNAYTYTLAYNSIFGLIGTVTYPSGFTALNVYNSLGYLSQIKDNATGSALFTVNNRDAELHLTQSTFGNTVVATNTFDANTGRLTNVRSGPSDSVAAFDYIWDTIGNLVYRSDNGQGVFERYCYDGLNRLTQSALAVGSDPGANCINGAVKAMSYDAIGNITSKSDVGTYSYPATGSPLPHAVASIAGTVNGVSNPSYTYDSNGNLTAGAGRTLTWNSFNMAASIVQGTTTIGLTYDDGHSRVKQTSPSNTTYYLNDPASTNLSEKVVSGSTTTWHDYIKIDSHLVAERFCTGASPCTSGSAMSYFTLDHLGSVASVTNDAGTVVERDAYDPWGRRRNLNGNDDPACALTSLTTRGFTGHEHIDSICEINANARIYDPTIGRFMSADPIDLPWQNTSTGNLQIPEPTQDPQSLNRYSYVLDDPTGKTDPTGKSAGLDDAAIAVACAAQPELCAGVAVGVVGVAACYYYCGPILGDIGRLVHQNEQAKPAAPTTQPSEPTQKQSDDAGRRSLPLKGQAGDVVTLPDKNGGTKQTREYGSDGYPVRDVDHGHDHTGAGDPHVHDWTRPSDGSPPTSKDRQPPRPPKPGEVRDLQKRCVPKATLLPGNQGC